MNQLLPGISDKISAVNKQIGSLVSWCSLFLVMLVFSLAVLRYVFKIGSIPMQELVLYFHGILFMFGASYTLADDEHVRVDVFYAKMSVRSKALVNLIGCLLFLLPFCGFIFWMSLDYVLLSWRIGESSSEAGGLPYLFLLKSLILVMPLLLALQGLAVVLSSLHDLVGTGEKDD